MAEDKLTVKKLEELLNAGGVHPDMISRKRDGTFILRRGYFYRMGATPEGWAAKIGEVLKGVATVLESGDHWAAFSGRAPLQRQSHFWVIIQ